MKTIAQLKPNIEELTLYINRFLEQQQGEPVSFALLIVAEDGLSVSSNDKELSTPEEVKDVLEITCDWRRREHVTVREQ